MSETQQYILKAMALNYSNGHCWDHLDTEACQKAAEEIGDLREKLEALQVPIIKSKWDTEITMVHMLGMCTAELSVDLCKIGLFPSVGVDDGGEFCLGPFQTKSGLTVHGSASVHFSEKENRYIWTAYIEVGNKVIKGHWSVDEIPKELIDAVNDVERHVENDD